jgi:hypothetical protein
MRTFVLLLSLLFFTPSLSFSGEFDIQQAASWIQLRYFQAMKGKSELDRSRALDYAYCIKGYADAFGEDEERRLVQFGWESDFVNIIRDRKLPFHSWSYGIPGMQVDTAILYDKTITGRQLILDYRLNIFIACKHMKQLIDKAKGDTRLAEMAYNAGWNGMMAGRGVTYPQDLDTTFKKWIKFKESQL